MVYPSASIYLAEAAGSRFEATEPGIFDYQELYRLKDFDWKSANGARVWRLSHSSGRRNERVIDVIRHGRRAVI